MPNSIPKIKLLPEHLIDQIKAGEVIERSGNLLKEIIENSIDAGSTRIEIQIKNNGLDLIRLKDNGHGISYEDLPLAFSRHATSKISEFEEIYNLDSFGFRGEALASICAISKVHCISSTSSEVEASEIKWEGGQLIYLGKKNPLPQGTELVIQDLFFNTPARMKFIQSQNSEKKFLKKIIFSFILSYPTVEFIVQFDESEKEFFSPEEDLDLRVKSILPKLKDDLLNTQKDYDDLSFNITLIPKHYKTPIPWNYFFVNQRMIFDKQFHRIVSQCLISKFAHDDFHYICQLTGDKRNIDVNVHPSKTSIKCFESSKIYSLINSTIKEMKTSLSSSTEISAPMISSSQTNSEFNFFTPENHFESKSIEQNYRLDGIFSPHAASPTLNQKYTWFEGLYFLNQILFGDYIFNAKKLIKFFIEQKMKFSSTSIPLLVSIPLDSRKINFKRVEELIRSGAEIEKLNELTFVVRAIPEWLSSTPVKNLLEFILIHQNLDTLEIISQEWPESFWEEAVNYIGLEVLLTNQVVLNLSQVLREKLK